MTKALDCDLEEREFELQSRYYGAKENLLVLLVSFGW